MSEILSLDLNPFEQAVLELLDSHTPKSVVDIRHSFPYKTDLAIYATLVDLVHKKFARTRAEGGVERYLRT